MQALRRQAELAVPRSLVELEAQSCWNASTADLKSRGMKAEDVQLTPDMFRADAEERVALGSDPRTRSYACTSCRPSPEQVRALVAEAAQTYEQPDAVVRWHYEKPERLNEFEAHGGRTQRRRLGACAARKVEDAPTTFAELMEPAGN